MCFRFGCFELARFFAFVMLLEDALAEMVETTTWYKKTIWYKTKWCKTTSKRILA